MTRTACTGLLLLLCLAVPARAQDVAGCSQTLRVARHVDHVDSEEDRFLGRVLQRSGCRLQVLGLPFSATLQRRLDMLAAGDIDLMIGVSRLPEREVFGLFSIPFRTETVRLWSRAGEPQHFGDGRIPGLAAAGVRIAGPSTGWFGPDYEALRVRADPALQTYKPFVQGVAMVLGGRAELLLADDLWVQDLAPAERARLVPLPAPVYTEPLHFMYSRRTVSQATVERIDAAIREELEAQGSPR